MARYQEVREELYAEIEAGKYVEGARFPTDQELCARFGVSRHTVREAVRELQELGLLERRRGAGTVVAARNTRTRFVQEFNSVEEVLAYGAKGYLDCHHQGRVVAHEGLADVIGGEPGQAWYRFSGLRRAHGSDLVLAWTEVFVPAECADIRHAVSESRVSVFEAMRERFGKRVDRIEQEISAILIDAETASMIGDVEAGEAALGIVRRYYDAAGQLFEVAASVVPADRYTFRSDVRLQTTKGNPA